LNRNSVEPVSGVAHRDSAGRCRLGTVREHGMCNECMRGHPLQADFAIALADDPDNAELGFVLAHLDIENLTRPNLSSHTLYYQPANAHIRHERRIGKRLAMGIHSPNLHRKLDFNSWALTSIHGRIVRHNRRAENLRGLPQPEVLECEGDAC